MAIFSLKTPLIEGKYYHLYNRGNNKERLYFFKGNYDFFLEKYFLYLSPYVDTYCYCLLPNHFHFLIRIKETAKNPREVSNQFRKLFISYAMLINVQQKRTGCLLSKNFRRIEINNEDYLKRMVLYIHNNPVKHGIDYNPFAYRYSSLNKIIRNQTLKIKASEMMDWFGGYSLFLEKHKVIYDDKRINDIIMDD